MSKIDKIINYFRNLNEEGGPTMNTGTANGAAGLSGYANSRGPNVGIDKFLNIFRRRGNKKIDYRSVSKNHKKWVKDLENK